MINPNIHELNVEVNRAILKLSIPGSAKPQEIVGRFYAAVDHIAKSWVFQGYTPDQLKLEYYGGEIGVVNFRVRPKTLSEFCPDLTTA